MNISGEWDNGFTVKKTQLDTVMIQPPTYYALITCCLVSLVLISQYTIA